MEARRVLKFSTFERIRNAVAIKIRTSKVKGQIAKHGNDARGFCASAQESFGGRGERAHELFGKARAEYEKASKTAYGIGMLALGTKYKNLANQMNAMQAMANFYVKGPIDESM
ncbi:hypothetical protein FJZ26_03670 [Candidatus Parvarchaeota archaeon]|nr:hypothetical protein [Candidatus Parvarchaeota archaeon]